MTGHHLRRAIFVFPLVILMAILLINAKNTLQADLYMMVADRTIKSWTQAKTVRFTSDDWNDAEYNLQRALAIDGSNPKIVFKLGVLHRRLAGSMERRHWQSRVNARKAISYYKSSIAMRPVSPLAWESLAAMKEQAMTIDSELWNALAQAARLGPWESWNTFSVSRMVMAHCKIMPEPMDDTMTGFLQNGFMLHAGALQPHANPDSCPDRKVADVMRAYL